MADPSSGSSNLSKTIVRPASSSFATAASTLSSAAASSSTTQASSSSSIEQKRPSGNNEPERQAQPYPPGTRQRPGANAVIVNGNQRGNPMLDMIRFVPWEFGNINADYQLAPTTGMLFLSLKYHRLHPEYIYERTQSLAGAYTLRLLMVMVDIDNHQDSLREITKMAIISKWTLICAFSREEVAKYIESFKFFQYKPPDAIRPKFRKDYQSRLNHGLTRIRGITQADVVPLMQRFKTVKRLIHAKEADLQLVKGIGEVKANYLYRTFHSPFDKHSRPKPRPAAKSKPATPMNDFLDKFNTQARKGKQVDVSAPTVEEEQEPEQVQVQSVWDAAAAGTAVEADAWMNEGEEIEDWD
ncbi:restriction endonuclease type II-like protein [Endogone sp. FLAS-F59071]|nr:restriction endonuclease type II-like protein [Endogone sp. FLAS-F59071]|eukprot:RUS14446.1 restriction endonuclease type II-like protein [Endogone sp. FLAS-F59071]